MSGLDANLQPKKPPLKKNQEKGASDWMKADENQSRQRNLRQIRLRGQPNRLDAPPIVWMTMKEWYWAEVSSCTSRATFNQVLPPPILPASAKQSINHRSADELLSAAGYDRGDWPRGQRATSARPCTFHNGDRRASVCSGVVLWLFLSRYEPTPAGVDSK